MRKLFKGFLFTLSLVALLVAPWSPVDSQPVKADSQQCYVWAFDHIWYNWHQNGNSQLFGCPSNYDHIYLPNYGLSGTSSIVINLDSCHIARIYDEHTTFGPPEGFYGPGRWEIADLRPYGWNDRMRHLVLINIC